MEALEIRAITSAGAAFVGWCVALFHVCLFFSLPLCLGIAPNLTIDSRFLQRVALGVYRVRETDTHFLPLSSIAALSVLVGWRAMRNIGVGPILRAVGRRHVDRPIRHTGP